MNVCKTDKNKNHGPATRSEYNTANTNNNINPTAFMELDIQEDDTTKNHRSPKQRVQYQPSHDRKRSCKMNGWRAEAALKHDSSVEARRYYMYVGETPLLDE